VYWRNCDKCQKKTLSQYNKDIEVDVYCNSCWWADDWDGTEHAMDYDPNKNFFEQVYELSRKTPWVAQEVVAPTMVNSEYCNGASYLRNCYLTFWADYCENVTNSSMLLEFKDSSDCLRARESQLCYESIGINKCYNTYFSEECDACTNVWFSRNCYNCTNCIGCVNLRGATNYIFNVKYSKEEYEEKVKELGLDSWSKIEEMKRQAHNFWLTHPYRVYTGNSMNLNVTGEYVFESKNSQDLYLCTNTEESRYCQFITVPSAKECYDYSGWGDNVEKLYEVHSSGEKINNVKFSYCAYTESMDTEYSIWTISGKNNFGCVNLKRKKYCILNKEYDKESFDKLRMQIISDMKKNPYTDPQGRVWTYGETFPLKQSLFGYNETTAHRYFPKTKEQVLKEGYNWYDIEETQYAITLKAEDIPETIKETTEEVTKEVLGCNECHRGYKISLLEYNLLQKMNMPVPHSCLKCRNNYKFSRLNPIKLFERNCAKCEKDITTPFSPDRPEVVYCEKCYQGEFN
jgi:CxxC-x17-CxxC domain-containing protein